MITSSSTSHPDIAAVSGPDGEFALAGLAPGTYEVAGIHEKTGRTTTRVELAAGEARELVLRFGMRDG